MIEIFSDLYNMESDLPVRPNFSILFNLTDWGMQCFHSSIGTFFFSVPIYFMNEVHYKYPEISRDSLAVRFVELKIGKLKRRACKFKAKFSILKLKHEGKLLFRSI